MSRIQTVEENDSRWEVDANRYDPIIIKVWNVKTGKKREEVYNCMHTPIFGHDIDDIDEVNKLLDSMIKECNG